MAVKIEQLGEFSKVYAVKRINVKPIVKPIVKPVKQVNPMGLKKESADESERGIKTPIASIWYAVFF